MCLRVPECMETHDMSCSMEDSTSLPFRDLRKEGRPGVRVTVGPGMIREVVAILVVVLS